jgi:F420-non-reducing hydrogenase iron-sulfur subunit
VSRLQYATEMRLVRVMCTGRIDLEFIFRSFANGMDGVFIGGCRLGECNYSTQGNYHALNIALISKRIMEHIGLNPARLSIEFMSGAEGNRFAEVTDDFIATVQDLGPIGDGEGIGKAEVKSRLDEVRHLIPYIKRVKKDKLMAPLRNREEEDEYFTREEIDILFRDVISYYIDPAKCQACMICARNCPAEAIISARGEVHIVEQDKCIKCETCFNVCPARFSAVKRLVGEAVPPPLPEGQRAIVRAAKEGVA